MLYYGLSNMNTDNQQKVPEPPVDIKNIPTILIVEDDPVLLKMYSEKFKFEGFKVLSAPNGEDGLRLSLSEKIDMMLLDLMLPRLSGTELLTKLRSEANGKNTKVIVLTNLAEQDEKNKVMALGALDYLIKAMQTPEEVVNKVKLHLR